MRVRWVVLVSLAALSGVLAAEDGLSGLPPELAGQAVPQVLTPARLQQAQVDVAASVTVIDREMIAALGVRDIPELLRLVPGMMVTRTSGHEYSVNYHGTNLRDIRRLQVLVDGMSVYQPGLARILWSDLALAVDDVERIEVTRGPDAAAYGANSFSGVINIITTHPQDSTGNMVRVAAGNRGTADGGGRVVAHTPDSDYRLSVSRKADTGHDVLRDGVSDYRDSRDVRTFSWRSEYRPSDVDRLEVLAGAADTAKEEVAETYDIFSRYEEDPLVEIKNMHLLGRWSREVSPRHAVQVQAYFQETDTRYRWRSCLDPILLSSELAALEAINQDYAVDLLGVAASGDMAVIGAYIESLPPEAQALAMATVNRYLQFAGAGYTEACGSVNLDFRESRVDLEVQDTLRLSDAFRLVSGFSYRRDSGSSESYVGGPENAELWRLFGHAEYRVLEPLMVNVGAMLEEDSISGTQFSPRLGLNWRLADQQSLRLVGSRAVRNQDIYEEYADTSITFRDLAPAWPDDGGTTRRFFLTQQAPGDLQPEEITAWEIGWFGYFPRWRAEADVRWFREEQRNLISDPANFFEFEADNDAWVNLTGIEWQLRRGFAPGSWVWASYAYIDNDNFSPRVIEGKFTARHSGSLAVAHRFAGQWAASAGWYINRYQNPIYGGGKIVGWHHAERIDLRVSRGFPLGGASLELSANLQYDPDGKPEIFIDNRYNERLYGYLGLQLTF